MKNRITIAVALLIACFAITSTVNAGAILVVDTVSGLMDFHFGDTGGAFPAAASIASGPTSSSAGSFGPTNGFSIESAGGGLTAAGNSFGLLYGMGSALSKTTTNYSEGNQVGAAGVTYSDEVKELRNDVFSNAGVRYDTSKDTRDLVVPFPGVGFAQVTYVGAIIPEPGSLALMLLGCIGLVAAARRSR